MSVCSSYHCHDSSSGGNSQPHFRTGTSSLMEQLPSRHPALPELPCRIPRGLMELQTGSWIPGITAARQERFSTRQSPVPKNTQTSFQILNTVQALRCHLSCKDGFKGSILVRAVIPAESGTDHILHEQQQQQ